MDSTLRWQCGSLFYNSGGVVLSDIHKLVLANVKYIADSNTRYVAVQRLCAACR